MRTGIIGSILFILAVFQSTLLQYAQIYGVIPNLLLVFLICYALLRGSTEGFIVGLAAGIIFDMLFSKVFGINVLLLMYIGLVLGIFTKKLYKENIFIIIFFTLCTSFSYESLLYFFSSFIRGQFSILMFFKTTILPVTIYNSLICVPIYIMLYRLDERLETVKKNMRRKY